ncbi:MAG: tRNA (cytidine/uridine-2'-O-)-methyltransferase [Phycisphaerales bacterium]
MSGDAPQPDPTPVAEPSTARPGALGLHVVLHEPEIPNNTGSIGRSCVAMGCAMHLIHPLGFEVDEKAVRRAGLDYWPRLDLHEHENWDGFVRTRPAASPRLWLMTTRATRSLYDADLRPGDALVFGKETAGLPAQILDAHPDRCVTIPMLPGERSLNLACTVVAALSEAMRQAVARGDRTLDASGRLAPGG